MTWQRDDNLMSPGNLAIVAECLMFCEDTQTLGQIREIYPADVLGGAGAIARCKAPGMGSGVR